ncbi:MAG: 6-phosphogluconolactonase [Clostridia bacterium]|nr:6-phosphogluconolactonase [Clostridia bacterium]
MSILVYSDKQTAAAAAATLIAAQLIEKPSTVIGMDYDEALHPVYASLAAMTGNGLLDWSRIRLFQLCEYLISETASTSVRDRLFELLYEPAHLLAQQYYLPPRQSENWALACNDFEESILSLGGMDIALLTIKDDGGLLFNGTGGDLAPITHVEAYKGAKAICAGLTTVMMAKKLVVIATGKDKAQAVSRSLKGSVGDSVPASLLQLHANAVFILDEEAASML